jgi:uncharacterized membrane-anchored protein
MHAARRLALLILIDALLTLGVVHRAQQHAQAQEVRRLALQVVSAANAWRSARR